MNNYDNVYKKDRKGYNSIMDYMEKEHEFFYSYIENLNKHIYIFKPLNTNYYDLNNLIYFILLK